AGSVATLNALTLAGLDDRAIADDAAGAANRHAERSLSRYGDTLGAAARALPMMLCALSAWHAGQTQIVITGRQDDDATRAVAEQLVHAGNDAPGWTEADVEAVLKSMLLAIDRVKNPAGPEAHVALRGFSWIVEASPVGVVIAIEIPMGAAVAGPFDIAQPT